MEKGNPFKSRLTTLFVAFAFVIIGTLALTLMYTEAAFAAGDDATNYDYDAVASAAELETMPGVYRVRVDMNSGADPQTIGIPTVAKQNLVNAATKEMPAIIMGAAVNYEVRTGAIDFTPIDGAELVAPYSYFRYKYMEKEEKDPDGTTRTIRTLTGFDGSYYIVRVDISQIIADAQAKAEAAGTTLDGKYLHVRQENNKALLVATGMENNAYVWADTSQTNNKGGCKAAAYPLANNAEAMLDTTGSDNQTPYLDVILMSSAKNVAGADAGGEAAPVSNVDLTFYVDDTFDYKPWLHALDPNNMPTFPYTIQDDEGNDVSFETEADYNQALTTKFFNEENAISENSASKYRLMGEDLEIDVGIDLNDSSSGDGAESGIKWIEENMDFWSMEKAIANDNYDNHTIIMICEVPVLNALSITGTNERSVILDVNSFDIQIANNVEEGKAGLTIGNNASLRIKDRSNTAGAELAIGNNATMIIESGGTMIIDKTCTTEAEFDAASTVDPSTDPATYMSGEITIKDGGKLVNYGVINIEGTEGKPLDPSQVDPIIRDKQCADILVEYGGLLDNYGCLSLKGTLHLLGQLNNYGRFDDILRAYDPDKNLIDYHRGIQVTWKDDVTQEGVVPGILNVGIDSEGKIENRAVLNNYGDIVLVPGTFNLYGTLNNEKHPDETVDYAGHLYLCIVDEAIIPIVDPNDPTVVEKRIKVDPPKESVFNQANGIVNNNGVIDSARVELLHNGILGNLIPSEQEITNATQAIADAQTAVTEAQAAMDALLAQDNPSKEEIQAAYDKVVKAQNALVEAKQRLSTAEKAKAQAQLAELEGKVSELTSELAEVSVVDISNYAATLEKTSYAYTGSEIRPAVTVSGLTAEDYTVTYSNNKEVGTGTVTIEGKEDRNFKGKIVVTFQITKKSNPSKAADPAAPGTVHVVAGNSVQIITPASGSASGTVAFVKGNNKKTVSVPATVTINGKNYDVVKINAGAFKGSKTTKLIVRSKKLTKASVKGSLKGSKIKTVQVKVGKKKENKKYVKKYKKIFTKKNAGKKVKVKR